jgi:hypothetical protein
MMLHNIDALRVRRGTLLRLGTSGVPQCRGQALLFIAQHAATNAEQRELFRTALSVLCQHAGLMVPRYKSRGFDEEKEWRLIAFGRTPEKEAVRAKFRSGARGVRPYLELPLCESDLQFPLRTVYVGPTQDPGVGVDTVKMVLRHHGYPATVNVLESKIPYRP